MAPFEPQQNGKIEYSAYPSESDHVGFPKLLTADAPDESRRAPVAWAAEAEGARWPCPPSHWNTAG